jgi:ribosomal protein S18 acetylase RimI-like enzyme
MSEVSVRAFKATDEPAILSLADAEMKAHELLDGRFKLRPGASDRYAVYLRDRARDIDSAIFVAELSGEVVGLVIGSIRKQDSFFEIQRYGYLSDLIVAPHARRRGIGRALFDRAALWFKSLGMEVVRLHVAVKSEEARAFWATLGSQDFMTETWIDLRPIAGASASSARGGAHEGSSARPSSSPASEGVERNASKSPASEEVVDPGVVDIIEGGF